MRCVNHNLQHAERIAGNDSKICKIYFLGFLFAGMNIMLVAYFSAVDRPRPAIVGSLMRGMIAIVVCAIVFASLFGLNGVWLSFLGSEVITFAVILVLGRKQ